MKRCNICHATYPATYTHCPHDGSVLTDANEWAEGGMIRGKYRILGKLGQGGMASVYKALHVGFDEVCALKVLSPELASNLSFVKRFGQEAAITRKLQHPNAVRVEDIDQAEDGRPFMVMEFIEGESLKDVIQREAPLSVERACRIAKQVAAALEAAHGLGMVHRDIKPANIILTRPVASAGSGAGEVAKVLDFGIAKIKEAHAAAGGATLTRTGMSIGTPAYMSPEQAMGKSGDNLDGRADLYSLGIVMYEMLTGELPIKAETEVQMLVGHINTAPEPIRARRPEVPEGIGAVVMRCLEKDPARRPASAASLIAQIENCERGVPAGSAPDEDATVATRRPPPAQIARRGPARRSASVWTAVIAILVMAGAAWFLQSRRKPNATSSATTPPVVASQPSTQAEPMPIPPPAPRHPHHMEPPASAVGESPIPPPGHHENSNWADDMQSALKDVPMDPATKAQVQDILRQADDLMKKGDVQGAVAQYRRLVGLVPALGGTFGALGGALAAKAIAAAAEERGKALQDAQMHHHPGAALRHQNVGMSLGRMGNLDGDMREQQEALRLDPNLASAHRELGYIYSRKEAWSDAVREYREAVRLEPDLAIAHFRLGAALEHEGDSSAALDEYRRAAELDPREPSFQANYQRLARASRAP